MKKITIHRDRRIDGLARFKFIRTFYDGFKPFSLILKGQLNRDYMVFENLEKTGHEAIGAMISDCSKWGHSYELNGEDIIITSKNAH